MGIIRKLDDQLSNKIAAGEVVERPASVVKELVENAIDAESTRIRVDLSEGGLSSIRVLDNGSGMEADDVETAFYRHATSKIKTDRDLFRITSLGFRGEALPSIASVSRLTLTTSIGEKDGSRIVIEGGKSGAVTKAAARKGTEVLVEDLFFNTPARLKYLRTIHTELGHTSDTVNRLALAHPEISFELYHNGKELLRTNGAGDRLRVIAAIYGRDTARKMMKIENRSLDFSVEGFIAKPEVTRSNRSYISLLINGRFVKNFAVTRAIHEGYHTLLPIGRHPVTVISVTMDPVLIDVNVHPSKLEVRLSKEQELTDLIRETIKARFRETELIPEVSAPVRKKKQYSEQTEFNLTPDNGKDTIISEQKQPSPQREAVGPVFQDAAPEKEETGTDFAEGANAVHEPAPGPVSTSPEQGKMPAPERGEKSERSEEGTYTADQKPAGTEPVNGPGESAESQEEGLMPVLYPIGQLHGTYILAQNDEGLFIIDQHAAQERIKYEYFREQVGQVERRKQDLLVPVTFDFTQREENAVLEKNEELQAVGIELENFGQRSYIVRSHPFWFPKGEEESLIREMIDLAIDGRAPDVKKMREEAAILMSCKAAIKANRYLRQDEMHRLLETLRTCEEPYTCPHGRPVVLRFTTYEMERMFKRVM
ncbi:DNA mismatch repair endonuclease MutL [Alteribacter natronophilus]|uniref:DNA mismatch repair endonuclease MutL n=1 Tax=Alteribacter natronophilus TaxID=2583810 RepID=UPI00110EF2D7|nr:DNA mismatch repair endonuclease MutL [Alteribacter natronophilus]TMW73290.1 DNA mismatch repair endonuclease MutL [Alteribacter natronophilus]